MNTTGSVDCPQCNSSIVIDTSVQLTSNPPQYPFRCGICGYNNPVLCSEVYVVNPKPKKRINHIHQAMRLEWGSSISEIIDFAEGEVFRLSDDSQDLNWSRDGYIDTLQIGDIILKDSETGKVEVIRRWNK